jgi:release factor glutamine methyltransferase
MIREFQQIFNKLKGIYPEKEARSISIILFNDLLGIPSTRIFDSSNTLLTKQQNDILENALAELLQYKPVQYVIGWTTFYDCRIKCTPEVLIPRPETEELVSLFLKENILIKPRILDVGTGSGCIAIAIKKALPESEVYAIDVSDQAIHIAEENASLNNSFLNIIQADILNWESYHNLPGKLDYIISNPPYVLERQKKKMRKNVLDFEPPLALFVPDDHPLLFYEAIASFAKSLLKPVGTIFLEINEILGDEVCRLFISKGFKNVDLKNDLFGKDRFVIAGMPFQY